MLIYNLFARSVNQMHSSNSTKYISKKIERKNLNTYFYTSVHRSIIDNQKVEATQCPSIDKLGFFLKKKKEGDMYMQWNITQP